MSSAIHEIAPAPVPKSARRLRKKAAPVEVTTDPVAELREVVRQHKFLTNFAVRTLARLRDRTMRETGEVLPTRAPPELILDGEAAAKSATSAAGRLESRMTKLLAGLPIYNEFLAHVAGCGPIAGAYLVSNIRPERCENVSQLIRYCGFGCTSDGKSERRSGGPRWQPDGTFNGEAGGTMNQDLKSGSCRCSRWACGCAA